MLVLENNYTFAELLPKTENDLQSREIYNYV